MKQQNIHTNKNHSRVSLSGISTLFRIKEDETPDTNLRGWHQAFTLIELLVVVLIIGILAAIALPQYQKTVLKVRAAALRVQVDGFVKAQRIYFLENGSFTTDKSALSIDTETGNQHWYCGGSRDSLIYCNTEQINGLIFWEVWLESTGLQEIQCAAKTENAAAMSICKAEAIAERSVNGDWTYFTVYTN